MKLVVDQLQKRFGTQEVLRGASFTFEQGKIYGLIGRNGAGKTTFFNCLNEDLAADGGSFHLEDDTGAARPVTADDMGYVLSTLVFALYCVWQFVYTYGTVDFRYLLLFLQYVPMSLALTWCYDNGGSIWSPIALHMVLNALILASAVLGA